MMDNQPQRRERFRLDYPLGDRPDFHDDAGVYPVLDLSESGMRLDCARAGWKGTPPGFAVTGKIFFRYSPAAEISGIVLRNEDGTVAVTFSREPLPWSTVLSEERELLARYALRR